MTSSNPTRKFRLVKQTDKEKASRDPCVGCCFHKSSPVSCPITKNLYSCVALMPQNESGFYVFKVNP